MDTQKKRKFSLSTEWALFFILIGIVVFMSLISGTKFIGATNLRSMAFQLPEFAILAIAMMVTILTGGINLSVITSGTMGGIFAALVLSRLYEQGVSAPVCILLAILTCLAVALLAGALNGFVIAVIGAAPMMATLGTSTLYEGIGLLVSRGNSISGFPTAFFALGNGTFLGVPIPLWIFLVIAVVSILLFDFTSWGQSLYMVGSNVKVSAYSGINVTKVKFLAYVWSGFLGGVAMIIMMSRYNSARIDYGTSYLMQTVAACVLGGVAITGGHGKVIGVVLATLILQCISSGLNIYGLDKSLTTLITGIVLIGVLTMNHFLGLRAEKTMKKEPAS